LARLPDPVDRLPIGAVAEQPHLTIAATVESGSTVAEQQPTVAAIAHSATYAGRRVEVVTAADQPARVGMIGGPITDAELISEKGVQLSSCLDEIHAGSTNSAHRRHNLRRCQALQRRSRGGGLGNIGLAGECLSTPDSFIATGGCDGRPHQRSEGRIVRPTRCRCTHIQPRHQLTG
jgi:hypothetical protein